MAVEEYTFSLFEAVLLLLFSPPAVSLLIKGNIWNIYLCSGAACFYLVFTNEIELNKSS